MNIKVLASIPVLLAMAASVSIAQDRLAGYTGPFANDRKLQAEDLVDLSPDALGKMRNEVYASYGRPFVTDKYRIYFSNFKWYREVRTYDDSWLDATDKYNIALIKSFEEPADEASVRKALATFGEVPIGEALGYPAGTLTFFFTAKKVTLDSDESVAYFVGRTTTDYQVKGSWVFISQVFMLGGPLAARFDFSGELPDLLSAQILSFSK
jgi:hypothetical protein